MYSLNCKGQLLSLERPVVMGIVNITPDSFFSGSRFTQHSVLLQVKQMLDEGASIIDIGGQSTRPGSTLLSADEEAKRVIPAIDAIANEYPEANISVDTFYASVARQAVEAGASIVNDISSGDMDSEMISTVAALRVPYIIMHMKGTPQTMQQNPQYDDVTLEVLDYLLAKAETCRLAGIKDVIIDPGFGFGKNMEHNFRLLNQLGVFSVAKRPLMVGMSRKGMVYKTLGTTAEEALNGTTVLNTIAVLNGASILRVHDVRQAMEAVKLVANYTAAYARTETGEKK